MLLQKIMQFGSECICRTGLWDLLIHNLFKLRIFHKESLGNRKHGLFFLSFFLSKGFSSQNSLSCMDFPNSQKFSYIYIPLQLCICPPPPFFFSLYFLFLVVKSGFGLMNLVAHSKESLVLVKQQAFCSIILKKPDPSAIFLATIQKQKYFISRNEGSIHPVEMKVF